MIYYVSKINYEPDNAFSELSDDEKIDIIAKYILEKYIEAFRELAK